MLVFQDKGMAAMMVYQTNPPGIELYFYANTFLCFSNKIWTLVTCVKTLYCTPLSPVTIINEEMFVLFVFLGEQLGRFTQSTRGVFTKSYLPLSSQSQSGACHDHHFGYGQAHTQIAHAAFSISMATRSRHGARDSPDVWRHVQHSQGLQRVFAISFYR